MSAISSNGRALAVALAWVAAFPAAARARVLISQKAALAAAFPEAAAVRKVDGFLSEEQRAAAQRLAKTKTESRLWRHYAYGPSGKETAYAYFDRVVVRTRPATLMAVVNRDGSLRSVRVLSFDEPQDFLPTDRWLALLNAGKLGRRLSVGSGLPNVSGATLTTHALADAARRMLAIHHVLYLGAAK